MELKSARLTLLDRSARKKRALEKALRAFGCHAVASGAATDSRLSSTTWRPVERRNDAAIAPFATGAPSARVAQMSGGVFLKPSVIGLSPRCCPASPVWARDTAYAQAFGAGAVLDAFLVAFKIPNFLRRLFAEGAFSQSFVPVISEYRCSAARTRCANWLPAWPARWAAVLLALSRCRGARRAGDHLRVCAGIRAAGGEFDLAVQMLRWTFPYLFFISLTSLFCGVLNSYQQLCTAGVHAGDHERRADRARRCGSPRMRAIPAWRWPSACSSRGCCRCCSSCRQWRGSGCCPGRAGGRRPEACAASAS